VIFVGMVLAAVDLNFRQAQRQCPRKPKKMLMVITKIDCFIDSVAGSHLPLHYQLKQIQWIG